MLKDDLLRPHSVIIPSLGTRCLARFQKPIEQEAVEPHSQSSLLIIRGSDHWIHCPVDGACIHIADLKTCQVGQ